MKELIKDIILKILLEKFGSGSRIKIIENENSIRFACPICLDSAYDANKKRGNLYFDSMYYHCFNCGAHININNFLKKFGYNERFKIPINNKEEERYNGIYNIDLEIIKNNSLEFNKVLEIFDLVDVRKVIGAKMYLERRGIDINKNNIYYSKKYKAIVFLHNIGKYVLNINLRYINNNIMRYRFYNIDNFLDKKIDKKLLKLYHYNNIFTVDYNRNIYIVEGIIDSMFLDNVIVLNGINNLDYLINNYNNNNYRIILDNDETGRNVAIKYIKKGYKVFLYDKILKKYNISGIKDINDIVLKNYKIIDEFYCDENYSQQNIDILYV